MVPLPLFLLAALISVAPLSAGRTINQQSRGNETYTSVTVNVYADRVVQNLQKFLRTRKADPLKLRDSNEKFWFILGGNHTGSVSFSEGTVSGLSSFGRYGDAILDRYNRTLTVHFRAMFDEITANTKYNLRVHNIGNSRGNIRVFITNQEVVFGVRINLEEVKLKLDEFRVTESSNINIKVTGLSPLGNAFVNSALAVGNVLFKKAIVKAASDVGYKALSNALEGRWDVLPAPPVNFFSEIGR